jgi:hypothetical protein
MVYNFYLPRGPIRNLFFTKKNAFSPGEKGDAAIRLFERRRFRSGPSLFSPFPA